MANSLIKVDTTELDNFVKKLEKRGSKQNVDAFLEKCINYLGATCLSYTIQNTPRDTSHLARSWTVSKPKKNGNSTSIEIGVKSSNSAIGNPVEYAPYVEYGHRTRGKHHPENPHKTNESYGWVPGFFMLTRAAKQTEIEMPGIINSMVDEFMGELFGDK